MSEANRPISNSFSITGDFETDLEVYQQIQDAESYLAMRKAYPDKHIPAIRFSGIDALFAIADELMHYGIDPSLVEGAMRSLDDDVDKLSLILLEKLVKIDRAKSEGQSHIQSRGNHIPYALVDYLIIMMLEGMEWADRPELYPALTMLIRERLCGKDSAYFQASQKKQNRNRAYIIGAQLLLRGKTPSYRNVARILSVQPSTVKRWFPEDDFLQQCEKWNDILNSGIYEEIGELKKSILEK